MEGLPDKKYISLGKYKSKITLMSWIIWIRSYMEDNLMDTIFRVYNPYPKTKVYHLDYLGKFKDKKVSKWFQTLKNMGVGDGKEKFLPICNFDCDNLTWSGKSVLACIMLDI